jgi:hypothetical protein
LSTSSLLFRWTIIALCAFAMVGSLPNVAFAAHSGQANSGTPDNAAHYIDRHGLANDTQNLAVNHGIAELNRSYMNATVNGSGDVDIYDDFYGASGEWDSTFGITNCQDWTFLHVHCDVYRVRYNLTYAAGFTTNQWWSLGAHELGHTAGMGHRTAASDSDNNSCMRSAASALRPNFDGHDIDAINDIL